MVRSRSRSRSPHTRKDRSQRQRNRSRSKERDRERDRDRDRERDRDRDRETDRSRNRDRDRDRDRRYEKDRRRSRSPRSRRKSRSPRRSDSKDKLKGGAVPQYLLNRPQITEKDLEGKTEEEQEMIKLMGFGGFDSTKGKHVPGNDISAVHVVQKRKYRQYMNRKGGFNRPLDFVA